MNEIIYSGGGHEVGNRATLYIELAPTQMPIRCNSLNNAMYQLSYGVTSTLGI